LDYSSSDDDFETATVEKRTIEMNALQKHIKRIY
jgi:hypothetical protein